MSSLPSAEDAYFATNPSPRLLDEHSARARAFIDVHAATGRRVVLVTSGGTTVPLEKQTVRFIDNFSAGTRGATSAEYFLAAGYAVIFLHREFSLLPYSRHFSHSKDCFLDFLCEEDEEGTGGGGRVGVQPAHVAKVCCVLRDYSRAKEANMLLMLPFVTIGDYLHELRAVSSLMRPLGAAGLLYLAAAVSDFFVPPERMAEHKIQSMELVAQLRTKPKRAVTTHGLLRERQGKKRKMVGETDKQSRSPPEGAVGTQVDDERTGQGDRDGRQPGHGEPSENGLRETAGSGDEQYAEEEVFDNFNASPLIPRSKRLVIDLDPVPKFLKNLVDGWAPQGMIVSYKLETDPELLVHKARASLARYQHHLVIGNLLATRKSEVVFVSPGRPDRWLRVDADDADAEIEHLIIPAVAELHDAHVKAAASSEKR